MFNKLKIYFKKIKRKIGGKFRRYSVTVNPKFYRPSSSPFISGDTFRKEAKFIFDETQTFNPLHVKDNDLVFVKSDLIEIYFKIIHPKVNSKYILISHNSDKTIGLSEIELADEKVIHWFAQNLSINNNEKFTSIPIGFENRRYLNNGKLKNLKKVQNLKVIKKNKILSSYNSATNFDLRNNLDKITKNIDFIDKKLFDTPYEYLVNLNHYKFVLSPEGNGLDTHRIWEGLLTKTIPIVKKSDFSKNFHNLNIPILLIDNWSELKDFDEEKINMLYEDFISFEFSKFIKKEFWNNMINKKTAG